MLASSHSNTWSQARVRTRPAKNIRVEFRFYPDYARTAWIRPQDRTSSLVTRGPRPHAPETLLLDDVMLIDNQGRVSARLAHSGRQTRLLSCAGGTPAPSRMAQNARISLRWDNHEYRRHAAGQLFFENISPPNFSRYLNNLPSRRLAARY